MKKVIFYCTEYFINNTYYESLRTLPFFQKPIILNPWSIFHLFTLSIGSITIVFSFPLKCIVLICFGAGLFGSHSRSLHLHFSQTLSKPPTLSNSLKPSGLHLSNSLKQYDLHLPTLSNNSPPSLSNSLKRICCCWTEGPSFFSVLHWWYTWEKETSFHVIFNYVCCCIFHYILK